MLSLDRKSFVGQASCPASLAGNTKRTHFRMPNGTKQNETTSVYVEIEAISTPAPSTQSAACYTYISMIRVRFAPSPTGFLHIGSARTFIFNWLYARHHNGAMILRIDDTDVERNTEASLNSIFEGLRWLDLAWDEQYQQSQRVALHRAAAQAIFDK